MKQVQYLTDQQGNKTAAVVPIEDWNSLQRELDYEIPEWHKSILKSREGELAVPGKSWEKVKAGLKRKG